MMATHERVLPPFDILPETGENGRLPPNFEYQKHTSDSIRIELEKQYYVVQEDERMVGGAVEPVQETTFRFETQKEVER